MITNCRSGHLQNAVNPPQKFSLFPEYVKQHLEFQQNIKVPCSATRWYPRENHAYLKERVLKRLYHLKVASSNIEDVLNRNRSGEGECLGVWWTGYRYIIVWKRWIWINARLSVANTGRKTNISVNIRRVCPARHCFDKTDCRFLKKPLCERVRKQVQTA